MPSSARYGTSAIASLNVNVLFSCRRYVARGMARGMFGGSVIRSRTLEQPRYAPWLECIALNGPAYVGMSGEHDAPGRLHHDRYGVIGEVRNEVQHAALVHGPVDRECAILLELETST